MKRIESLAGSPALIAIVATLVALAATRDTSGPLATAVESSVPAMVVPAGIGEVADLGGLVVTAPRA
ncbi:MAG: hypothetical protein HC872_03995 [Gammaproteobacteria bacterium]|nr:hypothetical protein [Gammaproteobacteria bacterium]